jgi:hypothetical protein
MGGNGVKCIMMKLLAGSFFAAHGGFTASLRSEIRNINRANRSPPWAPQGRRSGADDEGLLHLNPSDWHALLSSQWRGRSRRARGMAGRISFVKIGGEDHKTGAQLAMSLRRARA